jgi:hypothetical protein
MIMRPTLGIVAVRVAHIMTSKPVTVKASDAMAAGPIGRACICGNHNNHRKGDDGGKERLHLCMAPGICEFIALLRQGPHPLFGGRTRLFSPMIENIDRKN